LDSIPHCANKKTKKYLRDSGVIGGIISAIKNSVKIFTVRGDIQTGQFRIQISNVTLTVPIYKDDTIQRKSDVAAFSQE
jgi:hypothetical protein